MFIVGYQIFGNNAYVWTLIFEVWKHMKQLELLHSEWDIYWGRFIARIPWLAIIIPLTIIPYKPIFFT